MNDKTALHTAARRYCDDRFSEWSEIYQQIQAKDGWRVEKLFNRGWDYSIEAYRVFPRYRLDRAIQIEVEKILPDASEDLKHLRALILHACDLSENELRAELKNSTAQRALRDEADEFRSYIKMLGETDLIHITPLPFRRVISEEESRNLRNELKSAWNIADGYWFPLAEGGPPSHALAFHCDYFEKMDGVHLLQELLAGRGIAKLYQLHEFHPIEPDYEIELSILAPSYGCGGQQYSTADAAEWLVYASCESSITIGGAWLVERFAEAWPDWAERTYQGPYSTENLRGTWKI